MWACSSARESAALARQMSEVRFLSGPPSLCLRRPRSRFCRTERPVLAPSIDGKNMQEIKSKCCGSKVYLSYGNGVLIGSCGECSVDVSRINTKTGESEWLDGQSPWTSERSKRVDRFPRSRGSGGNGKTRTTEEAMALLNRTRLKYIERGRYEAFQLCKRNGTTHSTAVLNTMGDQGLLEDENIKMSWLGDLFRRRSLFQRTGEMTISRVSKYATNTHSPRHVNVWELAPGAVCPEKVLFDCEKNRVVPCIKRGPHIKDR